MRDIYINGNYIINSNLTNLKSKQRLFIKFIVRLLCGKKSCQNVATI